MNTDDPKFTAHILGELEDLTPAERAEIEALLASDPAAAEEARETRALVERLRVELPVEEAAALRDEQRAEVLSAAVEVAPVSHKIVRFPRRQTVFSAIAACLIAGVCAALLFPSISAVKEQARKRAPMPDESDRSLLATADAPAMPPAEPVGQLAAGRAPLAPEANLQSMARFSTPAPLAAPSAPTVSAITAPDLATQGSTVAAAAPTTKPAPAPSAGDPVSAAQPSASTLPPQSNAPAEIAKDARGTLASGGAPIAPAKGLSPVARATSQQLQTEAEGFYQTGRLDMAKKRADQVLAIDPANIAAQKMGEIVDRKMNDAGSSAYVEARATAIKETDLAWQRPIRRFNADGSEISREKSAATAAPFAISSIPVHKPPAETTPRVETVSIAPTPRSLAATSTANPKPVASQIERNSAPSRSIIVDKSDSQRVAATADMKALAARPAESVEELKKALAENPGDADSQTRLGIMFYSQAKYDEAINALTKALALDPKSATAHNYLGILASQKGWQEAAQKELEAATRLDPDAAGPQVNLAVVLAMQNPPNRGKAMWHYRRALSLGAERDTALEQLLGKVEPENTESYDAITDNAFLTVREQPLSTFSIDVDTASYAIVRRFLTEQRLPPRDAVRIEELLNYFTYDYPQPDGDAPFSATMEVATCPWTPEHRLVRVGLKGREIAKENRPASNLVFLIDVSGSMKPENRLPLVKRCLDLLVNQLGEEDSVGIVVYAGNSGCVLEPTSRKADIRAALERLEAGGSTNGGSGIKLAYQLAESGFRKGATNRVILATDGDFNVGVTNQTELVRLIEKKAKSGVFLTVLGFGMGNLKDSTLEKLADKGNGNYAYIDTLLEGKKVLVEQMSGTLVTIAKDVKIQVEFNPAQVAAYRLIGYENRLLKKEDFNDDTKDAGEIGAGHTVTALYEIVPVGTQLASLGKPVDALKYQPAPALKPAPVEAKDASGPASNELLTLKLRYKAPDGDTSKLLEFPLTDRGATWEKSSRDFRFAAAVASYGLLLRESPHKGQATWNSTLELAMEGKGEDLNGYRTEFISLVEKAKALAR